MEKAVLRKKLIKHVHPHITDVTTEMIENSSLDLLVPLLLNTIGLVLGELEKKDVLKIENLNNVY